MKNVLLTGADGFIGRRCIPRLVALGYGVHAVSRNPVTSEDKNVVWHRIDLLDSRETAALIKKERPEGVLHLAWYTKHEDFWSSPENLKWVEASTALVRAFAEHGGKRFVGCGTVGEYEWGHGNCIEDVTPSRPGTLYGSCKIAFKTVLDGMSLSGDLSTAWGRVFFLYGPNEAPNRLVASVIRSILQGEPARCSHGNQIRDYLHVDDVADGLTCLFGSSFQGTMNVSSGVPLALKDIINRIGEKLNRPDLIELGARDAPDGEAPVLVGDNRRLLEHTNWSPGHTLDSGLEDAIRWWKEKLG